MRKKGKKVIRPAGDELMDYLNRGFAICNRCGAVMDRREDPRGGCDIYACPSCGWEIDEMEYEYESGDPMELVQDERGDDYLVFRNDMPPAGCRACGGPYPYCKPPIYLSMYGQRYCCDHPVYNHCTLFLVGERGLAVIQQRYDPETKHTFWAEVDEWLTDPLYLHPRFRAFFDRRAGTGTDGLYPTVTIRQIMWALKMKPLPKQPWETVFDHTPI